ncbi:SprT family zinc-dependent metalloprotease [Coraliomargarita sp. SDUM461003]|uniref:SprT family zinc-dependent metalloprotease n=1 Tax=Thalassobacterium maritimum TaxID=3041265 RepID=A0ABU1AT50_9BACT|nr:SprT family zinc-dependent metalloprotease [Coraliomargarita sp. SDUM461003]MDQ8207329.1 SprT family zinc-dependent metalloprotease [Coraliomargarita sp. SDUM461003]
MLDQIKLGELTCDVLRKDIKNVHLSVHPPTGRVTVAAPEHMKLDTIRVYVISKLGWIQAQQRKMAEQDRETPREYLERESHYLWGKRYLLSIIEAERPPEITLSHQKLLLRIRPGSSQAKREAILEEWYREQLKAELPKLIKKWESRLEVEVKKFYVRRMKTKWGSCTHHRGTIRLNTELTKKPKSCLEYLVVHEMVHLLEPTHNERFVGLMDRHLPNWRHTRNVLNDLPVRHEAWRY